MRGKQLVIVVRGYITCDELHSIITDLRDGALVSESADDAAFQFDRRHGQYAIFSFQSPLRLYGELSI
jgi:hypothetical protein